MWEFWGPWRHTIDGEVAESGACRPLHLDVAVLEEKEDGLESVAVDFSDIWLQQATVSMGTQQVLMGLGLTSLGDLGEGQAGTPLQVDVVGVHERTQGAKRVAGEEVGLGSL